jgi:short-chain fatty acids transporter
MISRLGLVISRVFHRVCPDPFVIAILLTIIMGIVAVAAGRFDSEPISLAQRAVAVLDAWRADSGFWKLLGFGMQMCLILVTGHALAATRPMRSMIVMVAGWPRTSAGGAVVVSLTACLAGLVNWGLGLIVGALVARDVGRSLTRRGIPVHYPLLAAAGYMGLLIFHGGLSGSAPLSATTKAGALKVLPESAVHLLGEGVSLERTLLSPLNLFVTGGLVVLLPILFRLLSPQRPEDMRPMPAELARPSFTSVEEQPSRTSSMTIPDRLDRSPVIMWLLAIPLALGLWRYARVSSFASISLNEVNAAMLALGLFLHGSPRAYMLAIEDGARDCGSIMIQFPIYAGIMAMIGAAHLIEPITTQFTSVASARTLPCFSFFAATLVGLLVPSGGAQWGMQGPLALQTGAALGVEPGRMIMSIAYGDELANMLQPFWALPLLAITGVRARDIVGYTAVAMLVAGAWMTLGLLIF